MLARLCLASFLVLLSLPALAQSNSIVNYRNGSSVIQVSPAAPLPVTPSAPTPSALTTTEAKVTIAVTNTYQQALALSATRKGCTIQYVAVAGTKGYVFFGSAPADTTTSFQLTNGQSINCSLASGGVLTDAVQVTATGTDIFVVSNQ